MYYYYYLVTQYLQQSQMINVTSRVNHAGSNIQNPISKIINWYHIIIIISSNIR